jgi:hypothetical protein
MKLVAPDRFCLNSPAQSAARATSRALGLLCTAALLAWAPIAQAKDETTPLTVDASFNAADAGAKGFVVTDATALKGIKRVAVPVFAVEFIVADNVSTTTSGFASAGRATSSLYYKLLGVGEADFQAITDKLYAEFLAELKASGVDVLSAADVAAAPTYRKLLASGSPAPIKSDSSLMMSPPGLGIYGFAKMGGGNSAQRKSLFSAFADVGAGFAAVGAITDTIQLGTELDATLLEVRMRVSFVQLSDDSKGFFGRLAGTAQTSGKSFPSIDNVMMGVQTGPMRSTVTAKHTLSLSADAFTEVREKATTTGDVVGAVALGILKLAIGSKDSSSTKELEVVAEPKTFSSVVGGGLGAAGSMLVARMKADR